MNITLPKTADCAKLAAVIGGVVFLTIVAAIILRRWKKQATYPSPYNPVSSPEIQMCYVDPIIPTSMTPEKTSDVTVGEASSQEDVLTGSVRRSCNSEVKRNPPRSTKRRPVATHPILLETEDRSTEEEEDYAPQPPRSSRKVKRKSQRPLDRAYQAGTSHITLHIVQCVGILFHLPMEALTGAHQTRIGSPMYTTHPLVPHCNPYHSTHLHPYPYPLPMGPYGCTIGGPGTNVNSGVGNITHMTISGIGNNSSVNDGYGAPRTRTQRTADKDESEGCEVCLC
ncbi:hypothetical protein BYT27DRAFT_7262057 [Phlegmacium glaucopus]|nr:hypothetical protein BYT27DRAFT_7262057 [Phlegmacium glaucopus]